MSPTYSRTPGNENGTEVPTPRTAVPVPMLQPPWTPNNPLAYPAVDDESLPLEPPSPYSPPPASLMSGENLSNEGDYDYYGMETDPSLDDTQTTIPTSTVQRPRRRRPPLQTRVISSAPPQGIQNHREKVDRSELMPAVLYMKDQVQTSLESIQRLQAEKAALLVEAKHFNEELHQFQKSLVAAKTAQRSAQDRATAAEVALREQKLQTQQTIEQTVQKELQQQERQYTEQVEELQLQMKTLQGNLADATEREQTLLMEKEALSSELSTQVSKGEQGSTDLQEQLATAVAAEQSAQVALEQKNQALKDSYTRYNSVRAERDALQKQQRRRSVSSSGSKDKDLHEALQKSHSEVDELRDENDRLTKQLAEARSSTSGTTTGNKENDVPDRLARIRDAAERSALVQRHRNDLARQKEEHEAEIKRLAARHDQDLKDVFEEAKTKVTARLRDSRRKIQQDVQAKLTTAERQHQSELARVQRECSNNTLAAEEAVKASEEEVAIITQQLDKEVGVREGLESTLRELERNLTVEKQRNKMSDRWMADRKTWDREQKTIIANLQQGCNAVFEGTLASHKTPSPTSVVAVEMDDSLFSNGGLDDSTVAPKTPWKDNWTEKPTTSYASPLDMSHAIDETEAIVRSMLDGK